MSDKRYTDKNGISWENEKECFQCTILGLCGCGDSDSIMIYIGEMLTKLDKQEWEPYENLPYMFFVSWANKQEIAEHGTTIRCSWLTEKGKEILKQIEKFTEVIEYEP